MGSRHKTLINAVSRLNYKFTISFLPLRFPRPLSSTPSSFPHYLLTKVFVLRDSQFMSILLILWFYNFVFNLIFLLSCTSTIEMEEILKNNIDNKKKTKIYVYFSKYKINITTTDSFCKSLVSSLHPFY